MNEIAIYPEEVGSIELDGINFKRRTFIKVLIDGEFFDKISSFQDGAVFWKELNRSAEKSGRYLIFTCACGIAEDAGWEMIDVVHFEKEIAWSFERNGMQQYVFDKTDYVNQIRYCEQHINLTEYPLAIDDAVFPRYE